MWWLNQTQLEADTVQLDKKSTQTILKKRQGQPRMSPEDTPCKNYSRCWLGTFLNRILYRRRSCQIHSPGQTCRLDIPDRSLRPGHPCTCPPHKADKIR